MALNTAFKGVFPPDHDIFKLNGYSYYSLIDRKDRRYSHAVASLGSSSKA